MSPFEAKRVSHEYTQTNDAPTENVFPLLCPVREAEWVPGWQYRLIYSESGVAEDGCVFSTPNDAGPETVWMVTHYDPAAFTIAYAWVEPGMIATQLRISLLPPRVARRVRAFVISTPDFPRQGTPCSTVTPPNGSGTRCRAGKRPSITSCATAA